MSNKVYDILKKISLMFVPVATFLAALTEIWGFAWGTEICATISALGVLLGAVLDITTKSYWNEVANGHDDETEGVG